MAKENNTDEKYMSRCLELAQHGMGTVAPNPMVGAVIVCDGKIIGEGFHRQFGKPHAEVNAINSVKDKEQLKQSTIYVSLEPCSHFGKTPPCCDLIIRCGIPRVVVGIIDPFAKVKGRGIAKMKAAGIDVKTGVLEKECEELNCRFIMFQKHHRPYIILKWAQTIDGYIDGIHSEDKLSQSPVCISNSLSHILVHKQRTEESAVLVGTNTALFDNPSLTVRSWSGKQPLRLILDRQNRLPETLNIKDGTGPTIIFTEKELLSKTNLIYARLNFKENIIPQINAYLYENQIQSVVIEGGRQLLQSYIDQGIWDEAHVYIGNKWLGGGVCAPKLSALPVKSERLDDDTLLIFRNQLHL